MKGGRKSSRKRTRRKKAGDYSQLAKDLMKKRAQEKKETKNKIILQNIRKKLNKNLTMSPDELMRQRPVSSKSTDLTIPSPWRKTMRVGGKRKLKKRKRKSRKKRRRTRKRR